jgi:hypothetical protein
MNKKIYKLAFSGKMGAGKTSASLTALGLLSEKYGKDNAIGYIIKFSNPLHQTAYAFHRREKPKVFLQRLGDLARREFGDDVFEVIFRENFEGLLQNKIPSLEQEHVLVMTDDVRFVKEYKLVKELGFSLIRINAEEDVRKIRLGDEFTNIKHRSEVEMELFEPDFVIDNNDNDPLMLTFESTLKQLFEQHNLLGA